MTENLMGSETEPTNGPACLLVIALQGEYPLKRGTDTLVFILPLPDKGRVLFPVRTP